VLVRPKKDRKKNPCSEEDKARNRSIARHRIVGEHAIAQLNRFAVLRQQWRGKRVLRHSQVVRVLALLVNRRTRVKPVKVSGTAA
jgi:hypothetical protein